MNHSGHYILNKETFRAEKYFEKNGSDEKLNILMITHHRKPKAARAHSMGSAMVNRGHKVSMIVISERRRIGIRESDWDGVHTVETPDLLWGRLRSGWDLWNLVNRIVYLGRVNGRYDLIHCFETRPVTIHPALFYSRRNKVPIVSDWNDWWGRGGLIYEVRPKWYRLLFGWVETYYEEAFRARTAGVTVIASALGHRAMDLGVPAELICQLPGGCYPNSFRPLAKNIARRQFNLDSSSPIIGFSSLDSHLDMGIVFEALSIVAKKYPDTQLIITGTASKSVYKMSKTYGVSDNLHFTGFLAYEDLPKYLSCADVFVLPFPDKVYNHGRWPNKVCEYMCLGRPTISNAVGDMKELFERHEIGLLSEWDPVDFAKKIIYLIEHPDVASKLGQNARNVAVTEYDWKFLSRRLEAFYSFVLGRSRLIELR